MIGISEANHEEITESLNIYYMNGLEISVNDKSNGNGCFVFIEKANSNKANTIDEKIQRVQELYSLKKVARLGYFFLYNT